MNVMRSEIALSAANLAAANAQVAKPVVPGLVTKFNIYFYKNCVPLRRV
jgi:hypothetical protein